ncbi:MAG: CDP-archaeol synthase [Planctomycetota bacterium]|nr:MAG: CDP-archaeol synthase [Planctomycetota bacterium]
MLRLRLVSATIMIGGALLFIALDAWAPVAGCPGVWLLPLGIALFLGSAAELGRLLDRGQGSPSGLAPTLLAVGGVLAAACVPVLWPLSGSPYPPDCPVGRLGWPLSALLIAQIGAFAWFMPQYRSGNGILWKAIAVGWAAGYFGGAFAFALALRTLGNGAEGLFVLVGTVAVVKCADSGAYFTGRMAGKTKLCPAISPGKTVEGLVGGVVSAVVVGLLVFHLAGQTLFPGWETNVLSIGLLSVLLALAGAVGDLVESLVKRELGTKDSGNLLPGLGGMWDVTDSIIPSLFVAYLGAVAGLLPVA